MTGSYMREVFSLVRLVMRLCGMVCTTPPMHLMMRGSLSERTMPVMTRPSVVLISLPS